MMASPNAPVLGNRSLVYPNMVGQKKHTPKAKTVAEANSMGPEVWLIKNSPAALKMALPSNMPKGCRRWTNGPAN